MKEIEVRGYHTSEKLRPQSFDIYKRAAKCLDHLIENCDPNHNYVPYMGVTLGEDPPHFVHHHFDWTEVLPYSVYSMVIARNITGSSDGLDIQLEQRRLLLSHFTNLDGLVYAPQSPWNHKYPMCIWEQARTLYALIYWFQDSTEEELLQYSDGIVNGLFRLSTQDGKNRLFTDQIIRDSCMKFYSVGALIDPLVKYYEITGNTKALQMAQGFTYFLVDANTGVFSSKGEFKPGFRAMTAAINGISKWASFTGDPELLQKAKFLHDSVISYVTSFGSTPCNEPACSNMELNMSSLSLVKAGYPEYWDQIDRFIRNQTAESQFLDDSEWVREKAVKGRILDKEKWVYEFYPADLHILPHDDYRDVVKRSIGGFMWTSVDEHQFIPASVMLCCAGHAMRSFQIVWQNSLVESLNSVWLNLHFNMENEIGEIISYEPYIGKTVVILKKDADLKIRIPEYAHGKEVKGQCNGVDIPIEVKGKYAWFGNVVKAHEYSLEFDLNKRTTAENQKILSGNDSDFCQIEKEIPYQARWKGNTVLEVLPESREPKRIYKRKHLDVAEIPNHKVSYFISKKEIFW